MEPMSDLVYLKAIQQLRGELLLLIPDRKGQEIHKQIDGLLEKGVNAKNLSATITSIVEVVGSYPLLCNRLSVLIEAIKAELSGKSSQGLETIRIEGSYTPNAGDGYPIPPRKMVCPVDPVHEYYYQIKADVFVCPIHHKKYIPAP